VSIEGIELPDIGALLKMPDKDKVYAVMDKPLFHSESLSRNSSALNSISPEPYVKISKALAYRLSASDGDYVSVSTEIGAIELPVVVEPGLPENIVLIPNNFEGKGMLKIMKWKTNPIIKSPAMDGTEVVIKKIKGVESVKAGEVPKFEYH
jgi:predicted molibdopterin-dependent oxidoreductase YjgC